jgi:hypothetical protein
MKRPDTRLRKWLALVATLLTVLAAAWLVYSRSTLFAPLQVPSHIPLDYECPFPLEADVSLPDYVPAVLDGSPFGMPDDHWGEARIEFASEIRVSGRNEAPKLGAGGDDPARYRVVCHGNKITEIVERGGRPWAPPWSHRSIRFYPSYYEAGEFGGYYFSRSYPTGFSDPIPGLEHRLYRATDAALWTARRVCALGLTARDTARWVCSVTFFPKRTLISRRTYAYDADGRLVEKRLDKPRNWGGFGGGGFGDGAFGGGGFGGGFAFDDRPTTVTERYFYDEAGRVIGHLTYEDSKLTVAEIIVVRGTWPSRDEFWYTCSTSYPSGMTWARYVGLHDCAWSAEYGADGRLVPDDAGVAGVAHFRNGGVWPVATVHFGADGRIAADGDGVAVRRYYWKTSTTWQATAHYGTDGRLVKRPDAIRVIRSDKSGNARTETTYSHLRIRTSRDRY